MNKLITEGNWNEFKGIVKQKYGNLVNDDETWAEGKADEIIGRIQQETGKTKEQIDAELKKHYEAFRTRH
ncbi:CsbD family protein [Limibacter armeniacum]|uniref:CsbD family protein n=1 Tax=Limibacter armeniacum TaxID=466084 RepID=UPI002FE5B35D